MNFPFVTAVTAGVVTVLQMLLAFAVSGGRGKLDTWLGDGGDDALQRAVRRHGNLAENAGLFLAGLLVLDLSGRAPRLLLGLAIGFVCLRLLHAAGLSRSNTNNALRLVGGAGTYLLGFVLGGALIWAGVIR